jgi:SAM-dependent methyltransferase
MVPETYCGPAFWEHVLRYHFACRYVRGCEVVDIACGEGYGTAALAKIAKSCIGFDCATEVVAHARSKYGIDARVGHAESIPLADASADAVVTFETIEHISNPAIFLNEIFRILKPGGRLIISTPNKPLYNKAEPKNLYHLSEMDRSEFTALLADKYAVDSILGQTFGDSALDRLQSLLNPLSNTLSYKLRRGVEAVGRALTPPAARDTPEGRASAIQNLANSPNNLFYLWHPNAVRKVRNWDRRPPRYMVALATKPR